MSMTRPDSVHASPRARSLWPREHGASVELLAPLLVSLLFLRPSLASVAYAVAACAAFLAHEPLLVMLGRRGARTREALRTRAPRYLLVNGTLAVLGLGTGIACSGQAARLVLAVPLSLALLVGWLVLRNLEKKLGSELIIGATLTSFSLPVLVASGLPSSSAALLSLGWCAIHAVGTLTARAFVYRKREGKGGMAWAMGAAVLALATPGLLQAVGAIPWLWSLAPLPFVLLAVGLATHMFRPRSPKQVGWALAAANVAAALLFGVGLRVLS